MEQENKRCWSCGNFRAYYTLGYCCIMKERNGYCSRNRTVMEKNNYCEQWHCRRTPRNKRVKIAVTAIPEIYKKISIVEELLKEDEALRELSGKADEVRGDIIM